MGKLNVEHIVDNKQVCRRCKILKDVSAFWKNNTKATGLSQYCKTCSNINRKETRYRVKEGKTKHVRNLHIKGSEEHKNHRRNQSLKYSYGITLSTYNSMFSNQSGCCKICKIHQSELKRPLDIDHDHETGEIRGLLCSNCNTGLGLYKDSIEILYRAIKYLEDHEKKDFLGDIELN